MTKSTTKQSMLTRFIDFIQSMIGLIMGILAVRTVASAVVIGTFAMIANPWLALAVCIAAVVSLYFYTGFYEKMLEAGVAISKWLFKPVFNWSVRRDERKAAEAHAKVLADTLAQAASGVVAEVMAESQVTESEILRDAVATRGSSIVTEGMSNIHDILHGRGNNGLTPA